MSSHYPDKFGGHRHCGSGDMLLVVGGKDSTRPHFNLLLLLISKSHDLPCSHTKFQDVETLISPCVQ